MQFPIAVRMLDSSDDTVRQKVVEDVKKLFGVVRDSLVPWDAEEKAEGDISPNEAKSIQQRWESVFGSVDDPKTQEKIKILNQTMDQTRYDQLKDLGWVKKL